MEPRTDSSRARLLVVVAAGALIGSVVFRAIADELDLSPVLVVLIGWAVLTAAFAATVVLRARRGEPAEEDEQGPPEDPEG